VKFNKQKFWCLTEVQEILQYKQYPNMTTLLAFDNVFPQDICHVLFKVDVTSGATIGDFFDVMKDVSSFHQNDSFRIQN